jgi:hypothetical protein
VRRLAWRPQDGFTITEVVMASFVCLMAVLATAALIDMSKRASSVTRQRDAATNLAREVIEASRSIPYERVSTPGMLTELQQVPGLEDTAGGGYTVKRGNVTYTLDLAVCIVDDPKDGGGPQAAGATFCPNSAPAGTADKNPEDYKRMTVTMNWTHDAKSRTVVQTGIVNNPGSASGPAIRSIIPAVGGAPYTVTNPLTTTVPVTVTTSSKPTAINWLLDGTVKQPSPVQSGASGLVWTFNWNIGAVVGGVLDGAYIISAEAFNQYGVSGPGRQETVNLNRRQPFAPRQVTGGRTGFGTIEIEWTANSERDIVGYEVFRVGQAAPVCALATQKLQTECTDYSPPAPNPLVPVVYQVYAYDKDPAGAVRQGDVSLPLTVTSLNNPPNPPTGLTLSSPDASGTVTLSWNKPSPADPDVGDGVDYYRIYRDGQALEDRVARWFDSGPNVSWQDTARGPGDTHSYWVTAVDRNYAESTFLGPVTG